MKNYILGFVFICTLFVSSSLFSQTGRIYTTVNDLSSSYITDIFQDSRGYIWISTEYGLNRFDGIHFTTYRHDANNPNSIKSNYVHTIFEDKNNTLIFGCYNGLMRYDRATDSFVDIPMLRDGKVFIPYVAQICSLQNGQIWVVTAGQGIFSIEKDYSCAKYISSFMNKIEFHFYNTIFQDREHNVWFGTEYNGVAKYNPRTNEIKVYSKPELVSNSVYAINQDKRGDIFIGHRKNGVMRYDSSADKFVNVNCVSSGRNMHVNCIENVGDNLLVGCDGDGIKMYNPNSELLEDYTPLFSFNNYKRGKVHAILQDRDKNLWIGLFQKGLAFVPQSKKKFEYYGSRSVKHNLIGDNCVLSVLKDNDGNLYVGTDEDGMYVIDQQEKLAKHFDSSNGFPNTVTSILHDNKGSYWIGTSNRGLAKVNISSGETKTFKELEGIQVNAIAQVKNKIYVGTQGEGLFSLDLNSNQILKCEGYHKIKNDSLPNGWISSLLCDSNGLLWIGHTKGVTCFNPSTLSFKEFKNSNIVIPLCICYSLMEGNDGEIWAGTSEGLFCFNKNNGLLSQYTTSNGLPHNVVTGICQDDDNNLWLSTFMGICKFNPKTKICTNYFERDGLQGNEFIHGAFFKDRTGKIYFGGTNGLTLFSPEDIKESYIKSKVIITDFQIGQNSINTNTLSGNKKVVDTCVSDADTFTLASNDNTFTISFSTLQYDNPQQIIYNYRIKELSEKWNELQGGKNSVTYNSLSPGIYTFQVKAIVNGTESEIRTITVLITPPWYKSPLCYMIYLILILVQIFYIIKYINIKINHKHEIIMRKSEEKLNEAKMQFFINISHEIRTPMTLIMTPLEKLITQAKDNSLKESYITIYRNAQRILRLVNQLLDVRKLDKGQMVLKFRKVDMVRMIDDIMNTFLPLAKRKDIDFSFSHEQKELEVWVDINNFDKILMNILSNAFKYTQNGGKIAVDLNEGFDLSVDGPLRNYFEIKVSDNGVGIEKEKIEKIFERFYQINNDISENSFGTGIGLHLTRSLVELHYGKIYAENQSVGTGTIFTIRIPLGCYHLDKSQIEDEHLVDTSNYAVKRTSEIVKEIENTETIPHKKTRTKTDYKVLVVEDDDEILSYLERELSDEYKILIAKNGKQGYEMILEHVPDLVISDIMMPVMDGITMSKKIKQNSNINHIPIILLTAKVSLNDRLEGMDIGADAYFEKPFNIELLRSSISNLILNRRLLRARFTGAQQQTDKLDKIELKTADQALMERIMKVINENIDNADLNVEMLAKSVGLSRVHVHRKLKELTNMSTRDFIKNIRLSQAEILLQKNGANISDVAFATGFLTLSHFSTSFKEKYGMTPSEYNRKFQKSQKIEDEGKNLE